MKRVFTIVLAVGFSINLSTPCTAMDGPQQGVFDYQDYGDDDKIEIYKQAAQDILKNAFKESKDINAILSKLAWLIDFHFKETWLKTSLRFDFHIKNFMVELAHEASEKYRTERSSYSMAKERLWGVSNKLLVLGILKEVATNLKVVLPHAVEMKVNSALGELRFYYAFMDRSGIKAFDENLGKFNALDAKAYPEYVLSRTYVDIITKYIYKQLRDVYQGVTETNEDIEKVDELEFLNMTSPETQYPDLNGEVKDWGEIDQFFQRRIIKFAQTYDLQASYYPSASNPSYYTLVRADQIVEMCSHTGFKIDNPEKYRKDSWYYNYVPKHHPLPPGNFAKMAHCPAWIEGDTGKRNERHQGLKIHISAKPETALKIAEIVLPIIHTSDIKYKVMYDLRYMRYIYYLNQYDNKNLMIGDGRSTQAGKFIALYPSTQEEAREIIQKLDEAFKTHHLSSEDFVKVPGDAQVGDTGGIFVRYGKFTDIEYKGRPGNNITPVDEFDETIRPQMMQQYMKKYNPKFGLIDERIYPWPDYMNNRNLYDGPLFGDMQVKWANPYNPQQIITWDNRPNCWEELKGEQCPHLK